MRPAAVIRAGLAALLAAFLLAPEHFAPVFAPLTRHGAPAIYTQTPLLRLTLNHLALVALATALAALVAIALAILTTRPAGREFLPLSRSIANIGQTFPPVAVLALAVPVFGFGATPTLIALFLYGLLPIFETALTGLMTLPANVVVAGRAMGMTDLQRLWRVELPLAFPAMLSGIRLSAVISLATATLGSTVAASTLGEVIIAGLLSGNTAFVLQGGLTVGLIAILLNDAFQALERAARRRAGAGAQQSG